MFNTNFQYSNQAYGNENCITLDLGQLNQLTQELFSHNSMLSNIISSNQQIVSALSRLEQNMGNQNTQIGSQEPDSSKALYTLQLSEPLNQPVFKEKGFSLRLTLKNQNGLPSFYPTYIQLSILTMDNPPKLVTMNLSGKSIIRGTTQAEVEKNGEVFFSNIVINEVSSHYIHDSFILLFQGSDSRIIEPLKVYNIQVRARRYGRN